MSSRDIPSFAIHHIIAAVVGLPGVLALIVGVFAVMAAFANPSNAAMGVTLAIGILLSGFALLAGWSLLSLLIEIARAARRTERAIEDMAITQKAQHTGTDPKALRELANTQ